MNRRPWIGALLVMLTGCLPTGELSGGDEQAEGPATRGCGVDAPCQAGQVCVTGVCVQACWNHDECASGVCHPLPQGGWCEPEPWGEGAPEGDGPPGGGDPGPLPGKDPTPGAGPPAPPPEDGAPPPAPDREGGEEEEGAPRAPAPPPPPPPPEEEGEAPRAPAPPPPDSPPPPDGDNSTPPAPPARCVYPAPSGDLRLGAVMPPLSWPSARTANGGRAGLDLEQVYCDGEHDTITFVIGAGWCPSCPDYFRQVARFARGIESAGGLLVYVEVEDAGYQPATSDAAARLIDRVIGGDSPGFRVGDGETRPRAQVFPNAPIVGSYPSAFVVRTRDMRVIADQASSQSVLPFDQIARDPDASWVRRAQCGSEREEVHEPNDHPGEAARIGAGAFDGGICGTDLDFYFVDVAGGWRLDLDFRHATGDLDVYVWDQDRNGPAMGANNRPIGSDSSTDDESFTHRGPALVAVVGFQLATSPYRLTITPQ